MLRITEKTLDTCLKRQTLFFLPICSSLLFQVSQNLPGVFCVALITVLPFHKQPGQLLQGDLPFPSISNWLEIWPQVPEAHAEGTSLGILPMLTASPSRGSLTYKGGGLVPEVLSTAD